MNSKKNDYDAQDIQWALECNLVFDCIVDENKGKETSEETLTAAAKDFLLDFNTQLPEVQNLFSRDDARNSVCSVFKGLLMLKRIRKECREDNSPKAISIVFSKLWENGGGNAKDTENQRQHLVFAAEYMLRLSAIGETFLEDFEDAVVYSVKIARGMLRVLSGLDSSNVLRGRIDSNFVYSNALSIAYLVQMYKDSGYGIPTILKNKTKAWDSKVNSKTEKLVACNINPHEGRTYRIPANYWSWGRLKSYMMVAACEDREALVTAPINPRTSSLEVLDKFVELGFPFYLAGKQFLEELEETDMCIDDLNILEEAPLPADSFMLLLPSGSLIVTDSKEGSVDIKALHIGLATHDQRPVLCIGAHYDNGSDIGTMAVQTYIKADGTLQLTPDDHDTPEEQGHVSKLTDYVIKILAALAAEPKIIEVAQVESVRKAKKGRPELSFLMPPVIGWRVKYVRTEPRSIHDKQHGPVAPHWRRQHIKRVPYGPRNIPLEDRPRKIVKIARTRVNSEYEEQQTSTTK